MKDTKDIKEILKHLFILKNNNLLCSTEFINILDRITSKYKLSALKYYKEIERI